MELIFNELSIATPFVDKYAAIEKMNQFVKTFAGARRKGFRNIRSDYYQHQISLADNYSLHDWFNDNEINKNYKDILYGVIITPFIKEDDEVIEEQYIDADYYFESIEHGIMKTPRTGLASAYLYNTLTISFSSIVWDKIKLPIIIENATEASVAHVFNVSSESSFSNKELADFVDNIGELTLVKTALAPNEKKIHLAIHHGRKELEDLCNSLKNSPYVIEMRSTNWGGNSFVRKIYEDGVVEIVLFKTIRKYALWVQTTGLNIRETREIARILDNKYS